MRPGQAFPLPDLPDLLDSLTEGCQVIGPDYSYLYLNLAAATQGRRSREELLGRRMTDAYPGIDQTPMFRVLRRAMEERTRARMENEFEFPDGTKGWFELRFEPVPEGIFVLSLDITERKLAEATRQKLESDLRQAQKMETIGRLAGGIAHDFNNILSVIIAHTDVALDELDAHEALRDDIRAIRAAGERAAGLTRQLLAFGRRQMLKPRVLDLNEIVAGMRDMLTRLLGEHIELSVTCAPDLGGIYADPVQLEQVILNLAVNSRDAMPAGGKLILSTANVDLDETYAAQHFEVVPGRHVMLSLSDTGEGMDAETRERVFEPFFTTKEVGKGSGLGLATVYGIVKQSGGNIWVYSEPGRGTTFKVYFPWHEAPEVRHSPAPAAMPGRAGGETVLVVEDAAPVRAIADRILSSAGYKVLIARNGAEALALCEHYPDPVHLLLTDVVMPELSGVDLAMRLSVLKPDLRVLFMSGYTDDAVIHHGVVDAETHFLGKPFDSAALQRKVREVLDG